MKVSKDAARTASRIFRLCSPDGRVDEAKMRSAIALIVERKPRDYRAILHSLHRLIRIDAESRQALVESAADLDTASRVRVEKSLADRYGEGLTYSYKTTPELLGGVRIRIGDDVLDGSVKSRLDRLVNTF
ncbi:F0F1 ATP synthase subunit delta [Verrucomicrobiaceae bacterium R5-34]|uniref:F0F1 ATP synthase subunit delta n=1 Tax=Oceaniferula flava TaxID=2800421 RepID=A0AAE2SBZ7_9BACT|nr:F0F1 ATP synthase subunit delta [Oceaniferula flavus]MBK1831222.1 F0F1 ATP synthase subunit delta [Verrucomicrobiaceae bacterium R5-34]MBK1855391.1 F0F1 ATP synthase subunit delta [Oceaniferula flavus]MBM1136697.1 F0F1 ATP synthase subunit delta [Oceaniferula flavus]